MQTRSAHITADLTTLTAVTTHLPLAPTGCDTRWCATFPTRSPLRTSTLPCFGPKPRPPGTMLSTSISASPTHTLSLLSLLAVTVTGTHAHAQFHHNEARSNAALDPRDSLSAMTSKGCYSSSNGLTDQGSYTYQTSGYCQPICVKQNKAVLALSGGSDCWCGDTLPPADSKVDDTKCDTSCNGYGSEDCM